MKTDIVIGPAETPITLVEAKSHCVATDDDDTYLTDLIEVATEYVESVTGRKLVTQTHKRLLDEWPLNDEIKLPFGRTQSITSIVYKDYLGVDTTMDSGDYILDPSSTPGRVVLSYDKSWPSTTLYNVNPITITFVCGYGAASAVPSRLKHAIKMLVAHWYEHREEAVIATIVSNIPKATDALLGSFRLKEQF